MKYDVLGPWKQEIEERIFFLKGTTLRALMTGILNGAREKNVACPAKSTERHTSHTRDSPWKSIRLADWHGSQEGYNRRSEVKVCQIAQASTIRAD